MGRRKIEIVPLKKASDIRAKFNKRKGGLVKKAYELGTLCRAQVALIVFSKDGEEVIDEGYNGTPLEIIERYWSRVHGGGLPVQQIPPIQVPQFQPNSNSSTSMDPNMQQEVVVVMDPNMQHDQYGMNLQAQQEQYGMNPAQVQLDQYGMNPPPPVQQDQLYGMDAPQVQQDQLYGMNPPQVQQDQLYGMNPPPPQAQQTQFMNSQELPTDPQMQQDRLYGMNLPLPQAQQTQFMNSHTTQQQDLPTDPPMQQDQYVNLLHRQQEVPTTGARVRARVRARLPRDRFVNGLLTGPRMMQRGDQFVRNRQQQSTMTGIPIPQMMQQQGMQYSMGTNLVDDSSGGSGNYRQDMVDGNQQFHAQFDNQCNVRYN